MISSRPLHIAAILILGASLHAAPVFAQATAQATPQAAADTAAATLPNGKVVEDIVARVNDQIITQSDYDRARDQVAAEARQQGASPQEIDDRDKNLLRDLIDQQLLLSKGKDLGITGESELVHRLDDIRKQNHLDSMEALEKAAQEQGVSYEDFKANIRNGIITQQVIRDEVSRHVQLSESEAQAYFQAHQSEFTHPESVRLREILIATPVGDAADSPQVTAAKQRAEDIEKQLQGGGNFEELAKTDSSGPAAATGGDLGDFRRGMLAKQLEDQTFILKAGQFTEPIRTKQGYVILEVAEHTPGGVASFKDVQTQVEETVFEQHMQPALRQYLTKLREAAYVDIKPGFVDSGASPDELRPTYSAYVPPGPKKKRTFVRTRFRGKARANPAKVQTASKAQAGASVSAPKTPAQVADTRQPSVLKPGKKEKVRFGQAPRETLPSATNPIGPAAGGEETQTATAANQNSPGVSSSSAIGEEAPPPANPGKTRFSARPSVHKAKKPKSSPGGDGQADAPSEDELATQKVQAAPLGLTPPPAKAKKAPKGEKTRYSDKQKQPEQVQQPYMGGQQPAGASPQPAAAPTSGDPAQPSAGAQP